MPLTLAARKDTYPKRGSGRFRTDTRARDARIFSKCQRPFRWLAAVCIAATLGIGCAPGEEQGGAEGSAVLAEVDGRSITEADLEERIAAVPRLSRPEFNSPAGRSRMLQQLVEEEVLYRAARDDGLADEEDVRRQLEAYRRQLLVQAYLDREQERASQVSDEQARAFFDQHRDEYVQAEGRRVRMLVTDRPQVIPGVQRMLVEGLITFDIACARFSTHEQIIQASGLVPGWVLKGRAIPWFGNHPDFHDVAFSLEPGEVGGPYELRIGHVLMRIDEVREARQREFEEVRKDVVTRLRRERSTKALPELLASLKERYRVEIHDTDRRSPEEIFAAAQSAPDPRQRVALYRQLVDSHPDHARALESWFMIGFIHSEELHDSEGARNAFEKVIALDSDSELAQSARWMLTSDDDELPPFEDEPLSDASEEGTW